MVNPRVYCPSQLMMPLLITRLMGEPSTRACFATLILFVVHPSIVFMIAFLPLKMEYIMRWGRYGTEDEPH